LNKFDFAIFEVSPWNGRVKWMFPYWPLSIHPIWGFQYRWSMTLYRLLELPQMNRSLNQDEAEMVTLAFLEAIAHYQKSPLVGAKFAVGVLEDLLTRIEQDIANYRMR
jgi:hypothetical protein